MCPGSSQQRDFAALFRCRRCASSSGGVFRFKRGLCRYVSGRQQRDFAALFRYRRCISSSGGIFRFKAVCVVMCSGGGQQRDFAALFLSRRCISTLVGIFRFKRGLGRYMSERLLHFCRLRMPLTRRSCCLRPFADPWPTFWPQCRPNLQAK